MSGRTKKGWQGPTRAGCQGQEVGGCWDNQVGWLALPKTDMPYTEWDPSGEGSEASGGEAAEDEDEAEEPPDLQPYSGKCVWQRWSEQHLPKQAPNSDSRRSTQ